jgi:hypothetical protein
MTYQQSYPRKPGYQNLSANFVPSDFNTGSLANLSNSSDTFFDEAQKKLYPVRLNNFK